MELVLVLSELIIDIVDRLPSLLRHQAVEVPFHNTSTHLSKTPRTPKNKTLWSMMCVQVCCSKGQIKIVRVIILVFFRILFFSPHPSSHCRRVLYLSYDCFSIALSSLIYEVYLCPYHCIYFRIFMLFSVQLTFHIIFY